jgi:hypothetical protein
VITAYVSVGRWVARCYCGDGFAFGVPDSYPRLDVFAPAFPCRCGQVPEVNWPSEEMVRGVERLLMMRPNRANRNWEPGETLVDLMIENADHGVFDGTTRLHVEENRIVKDSLPPMRAPLAVGA